MFRFKVLLISFILVSGVAAQAEVHEVKMLSNLKGQSMVFEPPVIKVKPGDSVKWIASNPGHNAASIDEMLPEGAQSWNGGLNEELVVKFDKEGVYGYKCTPHYILGMVGLVVVGDGSSNFDLVSKKALEIQENFAVNKSRFSEYLRKSQIMTTGQENQLKGFDLIHKGKVRDIYRYKNNEILIITSDRISAFDFIFNDEIDGKGKILTSLTKYWFRQTKDIIKNHLIDEIPKLENQLLDRAMLAREARVIPYEAVVRGYLTGSAWNEYKSNQTIGGVNVKSGYKEFDALVNPAFTPTTKAKVGDKDKPVTFKHMENNLGEDLARQIREYSIKLFEFAEICMKRKE